MINTFDILILKNYFENKKKVPQEIKVVWFDWDLIKSLFNVTNTFSVSAASCLERCIMVSGSATTCRKCSKWETHTKRITRKISEVGRYFIKVAKVGINQKLNTKTDLHTDLPPHCMNRFCQLISNSLSVKAKHAWSCFIVFC